MKAIPPKSFYKLSQSEQESEAVRRMNDAYREGDEWKKLAQRARKKKLVEPEDDRPDEINMKQ